MYLNYKNQININELISKDYKIYAHTKEIKNETLEEHTNLCMKYFAKIVKEKNLDNTFWKFQIEFLNKYTDEAVQIFKDMIVNTIALHDIGKTNSYFQKNRLKNNLKIKGILNYKNSNHSMLSSLVYIDIYFEKIKKFEKNERNTLLDFMILNAYVISRHHGGLNSLEEFIEKFDEDGEGEKLIGEQQILFEKTLNRQVKISLNNIKKIFIIIKKQWNKYNKNQIVYKYIYERLMLSLLVASDYYGTSEFMEEIEVKDIGNINEIEEFYQTYKKGKIYKSIRSYESNEYQKTQNFSHIKNINILRNELFLDAETEVKNNLESEIFYLEAPTGSGKSNVAMNLSFKLLEMDKNKNKIFYVYPFNTLVEQNIENLNQIFEKENNILEKISVINSIKPIKTKKANFKNETMETEDYKKALLNRQFLNYPMILTTHVSIFKYLFESSKEDIFPLHQLANSVIVLDEIQSYKNLIWGEIITFLTCYAKILNIKIIIMSATLPNLDKLSLSKGKTIKLIKNRKKYFENPIFKNRVKVDYSLLESKDIENELYDQVIEQSKINQKLLIEFISKDSAYKFYNKLKENEDILSDIELMTGDDNIAERNRIVQKIHRDKSVILVATQVIEAGVDIDMDIGYKNISLLDSEEQFLGRINRSCKKNESVVYFFKIDDSKKIYKQDIRQNSDITLENNDIKEILEKKEFEKFYDLVIERLKKVTGNINEMNIETFFYESVKNLEFESIQERLQLIKDQENKISVYLSSDLLIDGKMIYGENLWKEYKEMLSNREMEYAKRRVLLSEIRSKMSNFIYEIRWNNEFPYNDRLGELYFIEDGENYFKEGKLDKEKFINGIGEFI